MPNRSLQLLAMLVLVAAPVAAQRPVELGIDAGLTFSGDPSAVLVQLPIANFRVAFPAGTRIAVEPRFSLNYLKYSGEDALYTMSADLGLMYHLKAATTGSRVYLRPFAGIDVVGGGGESASRFHVGAGIGVKLPMQSERLALRLEGGLHQGLNSAGGTSIFVLFGLSFFTR